MTANLTATAVDGRFGCQASSDEAWPATCAVSKIRAERVVLQRPVNHGVAVKCPRLAWTSLMVDGSPEQLFCEAMKRELLTARHAQFRIDVSQMSLHRSLTDTELGSDLLRCRARRGQSRHRKFTTAQ